MKAEMQPYIRARVYVDPNTECWRWTLSCGGHGYPQGSMPTVMGERVSLAHRMSYLAFKGEIPEGYDVDHLCRNKTCVNPSHLEAVTQHANRTRQRGINVPATYSRGDGCPRCGSAYTQSAKTAVCRTCANQRTAKWAEKRKRAL